MCAQDVQEAMHLTVLHRRSVHKGEVRLAAMQATARLRHLAHLPTDRAFLDAGVSGPPWLTALPVA